MKTILVLNSAGFLMPCCFAGLYNSLPTFITHRRIFAGNLEKEPGNLMTDLIPILSNSSFLGKN